MVVRRLHPFPARHARGTRVIPQFPANSRFPNLFHPRSSMASVLPLLKPLCVRQRRSAQRDFCILNSALCLHGSPDLFSPSERLWWGNKLEAGLGPRFAEAKVNTGDQNGGGLGKPTQFPTFLHFSHFHFSPEWGAERPLPEIWLPAIHSRFAPINVDLVSQPERLLWANVVTPLNIALYLFVPRAGAQPPGTRGSPPEVLSFALYP